MIVFVLFIVLHFVLYGTCITAVNTDEHCYRTTSASINNNWQQQQQQQKWWWIEWVVDDPYCICTTNELRNVIEDQQQQQQLTGSITNDSFWSLWSWSSWWFTTTKSSPSPSPSTYENTNSNNNDPIEIVLCRNSYLTVSSAIRISNKHVLIKCSQFLGGSNCILDAMNSTRFFIGTNATLTVHNIHFMNGNAILNNNSALSSGTSNTVSNVDNVVDGGAIHLIDSTLYIHKCTFSNNVASTGAGGAIYIAGTDMDNTNSNFQLLELYITDTLFMNNHANDGGAIATKNFIESDNITIRSSIFDTNSVTSAAGAIIINQCTNVIIQDTLFVNNHANSKYGGAIALFHTRLQLTDDTLFSNNTNTLVDTTQQPYEYQYRTNNNNNNIYIFDDDHSGYGGTFVNCDITTIFCYPTTLVVNMNSSSTIVENVYGIVENIATASSSSRSYYNSNCHLHGIVSSSSSSSSSSSNSIYNYDSRCE